MGLSLRTRLLPTGASVLAPVSRASTCTSKEQICKIHQSCRAISIASAAIVYAYRLCPFFGEQRESFARSAYLKIDTAYKHRLLLPLQGQTELYNLQKCQYCKLLKNRFSLN